MANKKVLLLGATGMAGHVVYDFLSETEKYSISNVVFRNRLTEDSIIMNLTDRHPIEKLIRSIKPDIIVNCVGVLINGSKNHPDNAIYLNAYFPHLLERLSEEVSARLIHISTDCVFSGAKGSYKETDLRDADDVYGKSKGLGEVINSKDLTIRTSIIGPELKENGEGLFHWFMKQSGNINGYSNAFWSGVTTLELAKTVDIAIKQDLTGLIHLTNGVKISKYDLLCLFKSIWKKTDVNIIPSQNKIVDKTLLPSSRFDFGVPSYEQMLIGMHHWMDKRIHMYHQYEF